jgi:CHAT domain/Protein kinase domain
MDDGNRGEPRRYGPFRVIRFTGGDPLGSTYLAEAESGIRTGQQVDLRVLKPEKVAEAGGPNRLAVEIAAVRRVRSPRVVAIVEVDMYAPEPWIATEHAATLALEPAVRAYRPLPGLALEVLGYGLADALAAAHDAGVVHRDVKPLNVRLAADGPLLAEFLIGSMAIPSSAYWPPEQVNAGDRTGPPGDVFGLAATLAFAATGRQRSGLESPRLDGIPARLRGLLTQCLAADPARRPAASVVRDRIGPPGPDAMAFYQQCLTAAEEAINEAFNRPGTGHYPQGGTDSPPTQFAQPPGPPAGAEGPADQPAGWAFEAPVPADSPGGAPVPADPPGGPWQPPTMVAAQKGDEAAVTLPPFSSPGTGDPPVGEAPRYLHGQCPPSVRAGEPFSVLASIVRAATAGRTAQLKPFAISQHGTGIRLVLDAPGLVVVGPQRQEVRVRPGQDSEPVMFELRADEPGPVQFEVSAWDAGSYLGRLAIETTVLRDAVDRGRPPRDFIAEIDDESREGEVSLVVRYDSRNNSYRFEFRDEDNPDEVVSNLAYEPGPRIERLVADLDRIAKGRSGYSNDEALDYMRQAGAELWQELIPAQLREQFWERQPRIRQLAILAAGDKMPWELLYPRDRGHDKGFLVGQFPVTRLVFGRRPARRLHLAPAWFVLPFGAPQQAREEVAALSALLGSQPRPGIVSELIPLLDLIRGGQFGVLHFACHNNFDLAAGSAITLDRRRFEPRHLTTAAIDEALAATAPLVFVNACRSAGASPGLHELDGWASKFLQAGAGAFIGSMWAIRDAAAREFASVLYDHLRYQFTLGRAVMAARAAAALGNGDPTWLAYAVYGDPRASAR